MGSLAGHVIPGVFFFIHGAWWCIISYWYHFRARTKQGGGDTKATRTKKRERHHAVSSFFEFKRDNDLSRKSWLQIPTTRIPLEPMIKILLPALGVIVEFFFDYQPDASGKKHVVFTMYTIRDDTGNLYGVSKLHHITMYSSFVLSGLIDLLVLCVAFPRQTSMHFFSLAFLVEGFLFYLHTTGRDMLNVEIHSILIYIIMFCVLFSILRNLTPTNLMINLGLANSILLQGTWFMQAGYFLYGGFLDKEKLSVHTDNADGGDDDNGHDEGGHMYVMYVAASFSWHLILVALSNLLLWAGMSACFRSRVCQHRKGPRRSGGFLDLRGGGGGAMAWQDTADECNKLIVEEVNEMEDRTELQEVVETRT